MLISDIQKRCVSPERTLFDFQASGEKQCRVPRIMNQSELEPQRERTQRELLRPNDKEECWMVVEWCSVDNEPAKCTQLTVNQQPADWHPHDGIARPTRRANSKNQLNELAAHQAPLNDRSRIWRYSLQFRCEERHLNTIHNNSISSFRFWSNFEVENVCFSNS